MTDLMLVNPLFLHEDPVEQRLMTPYFPLGLLYLAAMAREAGYEVSIFDAMFQPGDEAFVAALEQAAAQGRGAWRIGHRPRGRPAPGRSGPPAWRHA